MSEHLFYRIVYSPAHESLAEVVVESAYFCRIKLPDGQERVVLSEDLIERGEITIEMEEEN